MRFAFTAEQRLFARTVAELLEKECTPEHMRAPEPRAPALWRKLASLGVVGMTAPPEHGGLGLDEIDLAPVLEETGKAALPEPLVETAAVGIPLLRDHAAEDLRARWLPRVASGQARLAVALDGRGLDAEGADLVLLLGEGRVVAAERVDAIRVPSIDPARRLFDVRARDGSLLTDDARAIEAARDRGAFGTAAVLLGVADRLIGMSAGYASVRMQFGKPIGSFQAVKHHLANALLRLEFARPAVYRAAYSVAHGASERARDVSMAKALASDTATFAARVALQVHGAIGYTEESDLHLWLKRAWALSAAWGDAARHRARVARAVLGVSA